MRKKKELSFLNDSQCLLVLIRMYVIKYIQNNYYHCFYSFVNTEYFECSVCAEIKKYPYLGLSIFHFYAF